MSFGLLTYDDAARREDLIDLIGDVSPDDNPLSTMLGTSKAKGTYHEWLTDHIARPTTVSSSAEGAATSYDDLTQPSRAGNFTHIVSQSYRVSGTERAVSVAAMGDPYAYQKAKALRTWKSKQEFNLLRSTAASGSSGVARSMTGIQAAITTHVTARNSGTSLSEDMFNEAMQDVWADVGNEYVPDLVLVPGGLKRKISAFTAGSTRYIMSEDKRLVNPVMVYESDFGVHRIMAHKDVLNSAGTVHMLGLKEDKWRIAYLRKPVAEDRPKDGDYTPGEIIGEFTLEYLAQRANFKQTGFAING